MMWNVRVLAESYETLPHTCAGVHIQLQEDGQPPFCQPDSCALGTGIQVHPGHLNLRQWNVAARAEMENFARLQRLAAGPADQAGYRVRRIAGGAGYREQEAHHVARLLPPQFSGCGGRRRRWGSRFTGRGNAISDGFHLPLVQPDALALAAEVKWDVRTVGKGEWSERDGTVRTLHLAMALLCGDGTAEGALDLYQADAGVTCDAVQFITVEPHTAALFAAVQMSRAKVARGQCVAATGTDFGHATSLRPLRKRLYTQ